MNLTRIAKAHFQLGGMRVDIHHRRIEGQIQHIRRIAAVIQHIAIAEAYRIHQQPVAHAAPVDEPELLVRLRRARRWASPSQPPSPNRTCRMLERQRLLQEVVAEMARTRASQRLQRGSPARASSMSRSPLRNWKLMSGARQRQSLDQACDVSGFGRFAAHEFAARRYVEKQIAHFDGGAGRMCRRTQRRAAGAVGLRSRRHGPRGPCASAAAAATPRRSKAVASPRKPSVITDSRSSIEAILLVACRCNASGYLARLPCRRPSSRTRIRPIPPRSMSMSMRCAPASRLFSTSSLTTDAGRSITSPAAI